MTIPVVQGELMPSDALTPDKLCTFILPDGAICPKRKHSRGYCEAHYRALSRAGAFKDLAVKAKHSADTIRTNSAAHRKARRKLEKLMPDFVDHLHSASANAARTGKANPAIWALLHGRVVEPIVQSAGPMSSTSTINIGVKVSGVNDRRGEGEQHTERY